MGGGEHTSSDGSKMDGALHQDTCSYQSPVDSYHRKVLTARYYHRRSDKPHEGASHHTSVPAVQDNPIWAGVKWIVRAQWKHEPFHCETVRFHYSDEDTWAEDPIKEANDT